MRKLLVAAVVLVIAKDAVPYGLEAWDSHRLEQRRQRFMALKDREIRCLDELIKSGIRPGVDVGPRIERCKQLAADPETGRPATFP
jgi:hypothetical protein